ncbi:hypothetical protein [Aromatoleum evansii]|uniref:hypothetical protein n=1 Tax=Aromatoleum evansii TaxID=59406 RepID=UPI00145DB609|nr:hypothetical protein [Aromatoleum evansii]NMG28059.1 hypothetical protein [Aromatoleum evansii]
MKSRTAVAISAFSALIALSFGANAAPESPPAGQATNTAPPTQATTTPTTPRHSHMTEKLGVPTASADSDDKTVAKEKTPLQRHNHQRDMK